MLTDEQMQAIRERRAKMPDSLDPAFEPIGVSLFAAARQGHLTIEDASTLHDVYGLAPTAIDALLAEVERLREALLTIAEGDMPDDWHPDNSAWWARGLAWQALRLPGWTADASAEAGTLKS